MISEIVILPLRLAIDLDFSIAIGRQSFCDEEALRSEFKCVSVLSEPAPATEEDPALLLAPP